MKNKNQNGWETTRTEEDKCASSKVTDEIKKIIEAKKNYIQEHLSNLIKATKKLKRTQQMVCPNIARNKKRTRKDQEKAKFCITSSSISTIRV